MRAHVPFTLDLDYFLVLFSDLKTGGAIYAHVFIVLLELFLGRGANVAIHARVAFLRNLTNSARVSIAFALHRDLFT